MSTTYTTRGPIRGCCGHQHKTHAAAERCVARERATQARHNCVTDRQAVACVDGRAIVSSPDGYGWRPVRDELPYAVSNAMAAEIAAKPVTATVIEMNGMLYSWQWL